MGSSSFVRATSKEDAVSALRAGAVAVAGGTDLIVGVRQGKRDFPPAVVDISRIPGLDDLAWADRVLSIGTLVTHGRIAADPMVRAELSAMADASAIVGSHATRAQGTIGGNVMNASPAMDTGAPLLCFDGVACLVGPQGARRVPLTEFWTEPGATQAHHDELLVAVELLRPPTGAGSAYVRLQYRRHMEIAVAGVSVLLALADDRITHARIAVSALSPVILRVPDAEEALLGTRGDASAVAAAADAVRDATSPISDVRGSARYRAAMTSALLDRAVGVARCRASGHIVAVPASDTAFGGSYDV